MEELLLAVFAGFLAGFVVKKIGDKTNSMAVFKEDKINDSSDILHEAKKAKKIGADSASIILAFGAIESRLRSISGHNESTFSINKLLKDLEVNSSLNLETSELIKQLANIRNETAHGIDKSNKYSELKINSYIEKVELVLLDLENSTYNKPLKRD